MRRTNKIIIAVLILAILLLGIGYAAIQNITLNISGTAAADPSQSNFKVMFTGTPNVSDATYVTAGITNDTNATITVDGLTQKGQIVSAEYTVQNVSTDLSADLSVATTNSNTEYFTLKSELAKTSLTAGEATIVTVTVELTKIPVSEKVSSAIGVQLTAMPVEPGKEGTSEGINGSSQTPETYTGPTIGDITNDNIGEYIDLGNNIVGTESTSDDWRILYKDGDTVYAILADYLPASQVPASTGLTTNTTYLYNVWTNTSRDALINGLTNTTAWNGLANGINGITVTGSPTPELLMNSYNTKNRTELVYTDGPTLDSKTEDYDLYVPHTEGINDCYGYWLTAISTTHSVCVWNMYCNGEINAYYEYYTNVRPGLSIRPVVSIPSNIPCSYENGVWTVTPETNTGEPIVKKTIGDITNDNIGEYIDLGNNIVGTESTTDDWRILYKEGDIVYAILADYLPNSTGYAEKAGLTTYGSYCAYMLSGTRDIFLNALTNKEVWSGLANGINEVTVTGAPTADLLMNSYNTKNGTNLVYTDYEYEMPLDSTTKGYDLYVPHTDWPDGCGGYALATIYDKYEDAMWAVLASGTVYPDNYNGAQFSANSVRPVVALPSNIACSYANGVWIVE